MDTATTLPPFHLAFPVTDLDLAKQFYCEVLGCSLGRSSDIWIDFNMFGHQIVAHRREAAEIEQPSTNPVDGQEVPIPHFGLVLEWEQWQQLSERLKNLDVNFIIEPQIRFEGQVGEQATMFLLDPSGNALEFKSFKDPTQMFAN